MIEQALLKRPSEPPQVLVQGVALRSGRAYLSSIDDARQIFIHGRKVTKCSEDEELTKSAAMRAEIYDILRSDDAIEKTGVFNARIGSVVSRLHSPPLQKQDWYDKLDILDLLFDPTLVGDHQAHDLVHLTHDVGAAPHRGALPQVHDQQCAHDEDEAAADHAEREGGDVLRIEVRHEPGESRAERREDQKQKDLGPRRHGVWLNP